MLHNVPSYSQFIDVRRKSWRRRSCGVVALKMVMEFWRGSKEMPNPDQLIGNRLSMKSYVRGVGWSHAGLVRTAEKYGLSGKNFDWSKLPIEKAIGKLTALLVKYPVIASIHKDFKNGGSGHLIVVTGINGGRVFYNDPAIGKRSGVARKASIASFVRGWKKRAIIIRPSRSFAENKKGW